MAVTLQQIADAAGVSRGTVDRALNHRGRIRPDVEERIQKLAREMGYQPSRAGRALAMARRKIRIGVILQYTETPFMQQVLEGVKEGKAEVEGFGGTVEIYEIQGSMPGRVIEIMETLRKREFNGIALTPSDDEMLKATIDRFMEEYQIPVVTLNADLEDTRRLCFVGQNNYQSGRTAAGLMGEITGGKGRVAVISGQMVNPGLNSRLKGFQREIQESFPEICLADTRYSYDDEWVAGKILEELLELYPDLTGIYITGHGDSGVCRALKKAGKDREMHVVANDFLKENKKWLEEGTLNFLIGQESRVQGHAPVMILFRKLFDNEDPKEEFQYTEILIKTKYNI